ncbi:MAG: ABC transporter permease [Phycisphaerales bacterium]|jgi:putative ABC transport system permease protein|nr:ABC transporter permease [Phycisphaerales bacterium]MBT7171087.1 ABC transporter permease [Phycisphaerales bacterium]
MRPLLRANLRAHWRGNFAIAAGCALACAILTGALGVGDSVQHSRETLAAQRIGPFTHALVTPREIAPTDNHSRALYGVSPVKMFASAASNDDGQTLPATAYVGRETILQLRASTETQALRNQLSLQDHNVWINRALADALGLRVGDDLLVAIPDASLPADLSIARSKAHTERHTISRIVGPDELGDFSLSQSTQPVYNIFLPNPLAPDSTDTKGNLWVYHTPESDSERQHIDTSSLLHFQTTPENQILSLNTGGVFLPPKFGRAVLAAPNAAAFKPVGVLSYFVNRIKSARGTCPYSFIAGIDVKQATGCSQLPALPADLKDNEIVLTDWLANDLRVKKVGECVTIRYTAVVGRELEEQTAAFKVRAILPLKDVPHKHALSPTIPGLSGAKSCREWESGLDVDFKTIRKQDEAFWKANGTCPKAFVNLAAARRLFASRYGDLTSIVFAAPNEGLTEAVAAVATPERFDIRTIDLAANARKAASQAMPFGPLFAGLSMVLIAAAGVIAVLLIGVVVASRTSEIGTLTAVGFSPQAIRQLVCRETAYVAAGGGLLGALAGTHLTRMILARLSAHWAGAVAHFPITFHIETATALGAILGVSLLACFAAYVAVRRFQRATPAKLVRGEWAIATIAQRATWPRVLATVLLCIAIPAGLYWRTQVGMAAGGIRFAAAAGALIAGAMLLAWLLAAGGKRRQMGPFGLRRLVLTGLSRRRLRTATTAGLLGAGLMISLSMGLFCLAPPTDPTDPNSATGGFRMWCESAIPVGDDLSTYAGRERFGLAALDATTVPAYLAPGDDASCLNLSRPQRPAVLGIDFATLNRLGCWGRTFDPALAYADEPTMVWSLSKQPGDEIQLGQSTLPLARALPSSILQGFVVMDTKAFLAAHPTISGHQIWLIEASGKTTFNLDEGIREWREAGEEVGMRAVDTRERVKRFQAVQNNYLVIFSALGIWGVILGGATMAAMAAGNVLTRRRELAMCVAMGFTRRRLGMMLAAEQVFTAIAGTMLGAGATLLAVDFAGTTAPLDSKLLGMTAGGIIVLATLSTTLALWGVLRGNLTVALREE